MPLREKPVAFDSVDFLPGFPSLSTYGCNPWARDYRAGACASAPVDISRPQSAMLPASDAIARAMAEAGVGPASFMQDIQRGVVPAALSGCGCGGSCGGCGDGHSHGMGDYGVPDFDAVLSDPLAFLKSNLFPIALGAALVFMLKRK